MKFANWFHYIVMTLAGVFFISPKLTVLLIIVLGIVITIGAFKRQFTFKWYVSHILWGGLYLLYVLGALFSRHPKLAGLYLENKLSILLFPLFFLFRPTFEIKLKSIIYSALTGYLVSVIIGIFCAYSNYRSGTGLVDSFTSVSISPIHHPTYMSLFGIILLVGWWQTSNLKLGQSISPFSWLMVAVLILYAVLCLSLSSLLFIVFMGSIVSFLWIKRRMTKIGRILSLLLIPVIFLVVILLVPSVKEDIQTTWISVGKYINNPDQYVRSKPGYKTGNEIRLVMWTATVQEIIQHPFGVGTGNVDEVLSDRLTTLQQLKLAEKDENGTIQFNPHNQFLQTSLEVGIIGGLLLLFTLLVWWKIGWETGNWMLVILSASLAFNGLFESLLQRQSGIVFYSFWSVLLVVWSDQERRKAVKSQIELVTK